MSPTPTEPPYPVQAQACAGYGGAEGARGELFPPDRSPEGGSPLAAGGILPQGQSMFGHIYEGRRVFVTGHTGFKGSWLTAWLLQMGAEVAGFSDAVISASNDLDEYTIQSLKAQGCTVTSWGVGTKIITADGTSALGGVFKMAVKEADGKEVPVMKFSNDVEKMTNPGIKTVYRFYKKDTGKMITDLVCLHDEKAADGGDFTLVTESAKWRRKELKAGTYTVEELLKPVVENGRNLPLPALSEIIRYADKQIDTLWPEYTRLLNPDLMEINLSDKLQTLKSELIRRELGE